MRLQNKKKQKKILLLASHKTTRIHSTMGIPFEAASEATLSGPIHL
jgi:hypothetical protein